MLQSEVAVDYDSTLESSSSSSAAAASEASASSSEDGGAENQGYNLYILAGHEAMQLWGHATC